MAIEPETAAVRSSLAAASVPLVVISFVVPSLVAPLFVATFQESAQPLTTAIAITSPSLTMVLRPTRILLSERGFRYDRRVMRAARLLAAALGNGIHVTQWVWSPHPAGHTAAVNLSEDCEDRVKKLRNHPPSRPQRIPLTAIA
jgi:hypothetical protein